MLSLQLTGRSLFYISHLEVEIGEDGQEEARELEVNS